MKTGIWQKIFRDMLFEGGKVPTPEEKKKMYDLCYRKVKRHYKKLRHKPSKDDVNEEIEKCLRDRLYVFQLEPEPEKPQTTDFNPERSNQERAQRELEEDCRRLNRINRDFWDSGEDREEERKKEDKRLKGWIEKKIRRESGYC